MVCRNNLRPWLTFRHHAVDTEIGQPYCSSMGARLFLGLIATAAALFVFRRRYHEVINITTPNVNITMHVHNNVDLTSILEGLQSIMVTQSEAAVQLQAVADQVDKIGTETQSLLDEIQVLKNAAVAAGNVTAELQAAIDAVSGKAVTVDALVNDLIPTPTP